MLTLVKKEIIAAAALAALFAAPSSGAAAMDKSMDAFTAKVVAAYGGAPAIMKAARVYAKGDITLYVAKGKGVYARYMERDRKLRVETVIGDTRELRILRGRRGWRGRNDDFAEVHDYQLLAMAYQYKQLDLPYGLLKKQYAIKDMGRAALGDMQTEVLGLTGAEGPPMKINVDIRTFRIVRVEGSFNINGGPASLAAEFGDFRNVDGVLMPYKITNYGSGMKISETDITVYKLNPPVPTGVFGP